MGKENLVGVGKWSCRKLSLSFNLLSDGGFLNIASFRQVRAKNGFGGDCYVFIALHEVEVFSGKIYGLYL